MHELPSPVCLSVCANKHKCREKTLKLQMTSFALSSSANTQRTVGRKWGKVESGMGKCRGLVTLTHLLHDEAK